jgi:hypothetical protein
VKFSDACHDPTQKRDDQRSKMQSRSSAQPRLTMRSRPKPTQDNGFISKQNPRPGQRFQSPPSFVKNNNKSRPNHR